MLPGQSGSRRDVPSNISTYIVPDGEVGAQAFAVIRKAIDQKGMVALGRVVFTSREHVAARRLALGAAAQSIHQIYDAEFYRDLALILTSPLQVGAGQYREAYEFLI